MDMIALSKTHDFNNVQMVESSTIGYLSAWHEHTIFHLEYSGIRCNDSYEIRFEDLQKFSTS